KESLLALAPVVYAHYVTVTEDEAPRRLLFLVALLLPAAVVLLIVRATIEPANSYSSVRALLGGFAQVRPARFWPRALAEIFSGLGILPALLLLEARPALRFLRTHPSWALQLVIGAILVFGGPEKARFCLYLLPALIVTLMVSLEPSSLVQVR